MKYFLTLLLVSVGIFAAPSARAEYPNMGDVIFADGLDWPTRHAGGANYLWYDLGPGCDREPYGLIPNYHEPGVRATVQQQLATMYARGMRTLGIGVSFRSGPSTGTLIDASDPAAVSQAAQNLGLALADIDAAGFDRVLFRFFPEGSMSPTHARTGSFDATTLPLYKDIIAAMHAELANGPLDYLVDLGVEGAPPDEGSGWCALQNGGEPWHCPKYTSWSNAARELWDWYTSHYGSADTVGFSFLPGTGTIRNRVRHMKYVYGGTYPSRLAIDVYGEPGHDAADQLIYFMGMVAGYAADFGFHISSFIISESWYNDPFAAARLASAIAATGNTVEYLNEWPLERGASCAHVSEPPPFLFDMYQFYGFGARYPPTQTRHVPDSPLLFRPRARARTRPPVVPGSRPVRRTQ